MLETRDEAAAAGVYDFESMGEVNIMIHYFHGCNFNRYLYAPTHVITYRKNHRSLVLTGVDQLQ